MLQLTNFRAIAPIAALLTIDIALTLFSDFSSQTKAFLCTKSVFFIGLLYWFSRAPLQSQIKSFADELRSLLAKDKTYIAFRFSENADHFQNIKDVRFMLNEYLARCEKGLFEIEQSAARLVPMADELSNTYNNMNQKAILQAKFGESLTSVVERMYSATSNTKERATCIVEKAAETDKLVKANQEEIKSNSQTTKALSMQMQESGENLANLKRCCEEIGKVVVDITQISEQTNLLALNAAIEAARAGDAGRGFSVVAGEVRALSQRTFEYTNEIQHTVKSIQETTNALSVSIDASFDYTELSVKQADKTIEDHQAIATMVQDVDELAAQIHQDMLTQSQAVEEVSLSMRTIHHIHNESVGNTNLHDISVDDLRALATALKDKLNAFEVSERGWNESKRNKKRESDRQENIENHDITYFQK